MAEPTLVTVPDVADALKVDVLAVRHLIERGELLAVRGADGVLRIPSEFIAQGAVAKRLPGVIALLRDGGYDDAAALAWLFTDDDSLPGTPAQALAEDRGTEVTRRAQALAW
jgi:hypothetical protein